SGVGSFSVCLFFLIGAFVLDRRVTDSNQLIRATDKKVIGVVNRIVPNNMDLRTIWENSETSKDYAIYKDLMRSLRFEIDASMKVEGKKVIGVTSLFDNAGSSFIASSLAYSFAVTKKRVLLIGGDYALDKTVN